MKHPPHPQFVVAMVFFWMNASSLQFWENLLGGVTLVFSCGSILSGTVNMVIARRTLRKRAEERKREEEKRKRVGNALLA